PALSIQLVHTLDVALIKLEVHFQRLVGDALEFAQTKLLRPVGYRLMHWIGPPQVAPATGSPEFPSSGHSDCRRGEGEEFCLGVVNSYFFFFYCALLGCAF